MAKINVKRQELHSAFFAGRTAELHDVDLKDKTANYFTRKMSVFRNGGEIAILDMRTMVNHRQVQRKRREGCLCKKGKRLWTRVHWKRLEVASCLLSSTVSH